MRMNRYWLSFLCSSIDLPYVDFEQDDCYVGGNEELEENELIGYLIDRHQHQSPNVEKTNTDTSSNQQEDIVEIKPTSGSDYEGISVSGAALEGTADTEEKFDTSLWFSKFLSLPSHFLESESRLFFCS